MPFQIRGEAAPRPFLELAPDLGITSSWINS